MDILLGILIGVVFIYLLTVAWHLGAKSLRRTNPFGNSEHWVEPRKLLPPVDPLLHWDDKYQHNNPNVRFRS